MPAAERNKAFKEIDREVSHGPILASVASDVARIVATRTSVLPTGISVGSPATSVLISVEAESTDGHPSSTALLESSASNLEGTMRC